MSNMNEAGPSRAREPPEDPDNDELVAQLLQAMQRENRAAVLEILDSNSTNAGSEQWDRAGTTPLHVAVASGKIAAVKLVLSRCKPDLAVLNVPQRATALHLAMGIGFFEAVTAMLDYLAEEGRETAATILNSVDGNGMGLLHLFAGTSGARLLWNSEPVASHAMQVAERLLGLGIDLNLQTRSQEAYTALHRASWTGNHGLVLYLLQNCAIVDVQDSRGRTPLLSAICALLQVPAYDDLSKSDYHALIQLYLKHKDLSHIIDKCDSDGRSAVYHLSTNDSNHLLVENFLQRGANPNIPESVNQWTALICASSLGNKSVVHCLLSDGADPDRVDNVGWTALHWATASAYSDVVFEFIRFIRLEARTDVDAVTADTGETALQMAVESGFWRIAHMLLEAGADPLRQTDAGQSILQLACAASGDNSGVGQPGIGPYVRLSPFFNRLGTPARVLGDFLIQTITSEDWDEDAFENMADFIFSWSERGDMSISERLAIIKDVRCMWYAQRRYHNKLCKVLREIAMNQSSYHQQLARERTAEWKALHWAAYLRKYDLVWSILSNSFEGVDRFRKEAIAILKRTSHGEEYSSRTSTTLDCLRNPPPIRKIVEKEDNIHMERKLNVQKRKLAMAHEATIIDFYETEGRVDLLRRMRPVWDVIYAGAHKQMPLRSTSLADAEPAIDMAPDSAAPLRGGSFEELQSRMPGSKWKGKLPQIELTETESGVAGGTTYKGPKVKGGPEESRLSVKRRGGPQQIMNEAIMSLDDLQWRFRVPQKGASVFPHSENNLLFRWIHLPENNMDWMKDLTKRIYREKNRWNEDYQPLSKALRSSWRELQGKKAGLGYMMPSCIVEKTDIQRDKRLQTTSGPSGAADASMFGGYTALYVPYLSFGAYNADANNSQNIGVHPTARDEFELLPTFKDADISKKMVYLRKKKLEAEKLLRGGPLSMKEKSFMSSMKRDNPTDPEDSPVFKSIVHRSCTLDEFYYVSLQNTNDRDMGQVVTRYFNKHNKRPKDEGRRDELEILRVNRLWLWVIDENTIITCSTADISEESHPSNTLTFNDGIYDCLRDAADGRHKDLPLPMTVDEMSKFITSYCVSTFDLEMFRLSESERAEIEKTVSARQIFAETLNDASNEEAKLFARFKAKIEGRLENLKAEEEKGRERAEPRRDLDPDSEDEKDRDKEIEYSEQARDYASISKAANLLFEVKDIRDEINILLELLRQQLDVWESLHTVSTTDESEIRVQIRGRSEERWKGPHKIYTDLMEMDKLAFRVQESVNAILNLEQNEASITEAESSRKQSEISVKQGRVLMVFTVVTIIFLPLSFLSSLFALNVTSFPHSKTSSNIDGPLYSPGFIFPILFGFTAIFAVFASIVAFNYSLKKLNLRLNKKLKERRRRRDGGMDLPLGAGGSQGSFGGPRGLRRRVVGSLTKYMPFGG